MSYLLIIDMLYSPAAEHHCTLDGTQSASVSLSHIYSTRLFPVIQIIIVNAAVAVHRN